MKIEDVFEYERIDFDKKYFKQKQRDRQRRHEKQIDTGKKHNAAEVSGDVPGWKIKAL